MDFSEREVEYFAAEKQAKTLDERSFCTYVANWKRSPPAE